MRRMVCLLCAVCCAVFSFAARGEAIDPIAETQALVEALFSGDAQALFDRLTDEMRAAAPLATLQSLPGALAAQCGALLGFRDQNADASGAAMRVDMEKTDLIAQFRYDEQGRVALFSITLAPERPAEKPLAEREEAVSVGPLALPGVLTLPEGEGPFPAVVLVHGSGPNDRDETLGDTAIFRDLAEGLSRQGIAVLRYDKRTYLMQQGKLPVTQETLENLTLYDETVIDAVAAVQLLRADARVDPQRVFVIGHSQGAMLATQIEQEAKTAGLVLLAGTLNSMAWVMAEQLEAAAPKLYAREIAALRALLTQTEAEARAQSFLGMSGYALWENAQTDTRALAAQCEAPMLILQGALDTQISADRDYPLWQFFVATHPGRDITLKCYEGLGHAFVAEGETAFSAEVLLDIARWILAR